MKPLVKRSSIDYSQSYTANIFISTVRVFNEYLLKPTWVIKLLFWKKLIQLSFFKNFYDRDLENLPQYKRRSPFDNEELITVYLRSDIEKRAIEVWGSLESLAKEKEKRRLEYEQRQRDLFNLKKSLRDYRDRVEQLENPLNENSYVMLS